MISDLDLDELKLIRLPENVELLLDRISSPDRLIAHLTLVHDVAWRLISAFEDAFPGLQLPREEMLFGAATHDIGKAIVRSELSLPGHEHEQVGRDFLRGAGISEELSRFAVTHADLQLPGANLADGVVALADKCWKGKRDEQVEQRVCEYLGSELGLAGWEVFERVDVIVDEIARAADLRLEWQGRFAV